MNNITIANYKPYQKGSLSAFFSVMLPSGRIVHECKLFEKENRRWIGLPSRPFTGKDGNTGYAAILEFVNRDTAEGFREAVLRAIDRMADEQNPTLKPAPEAEPCRAQIPPDDNDLPF